MEINLNDFFQLGLTLAGFYACYRAGAEQAIKQLIEQLQDAGVIDMEEDDEEY